MVGGDVVDGYRLESAQKGGTEVRRQPKSDHANYQHHANKSNNIVSHFVRHECSDNANERVSNICIECGHVILSCRMEMLVASDYLFDHLVGEQQCWSIAALLPAVA